MRNRRFVGCVAGVPCRCAVPVPPDLPCTERVRSHGFPGTPDKRRRSGPACVDCVDCKPHRGTGTRHGSTSAAPERTAAGCPDGRRPRRRGVHDGRAGGDRREQVAARRELRHRRPRVLDRRHRRGRRVDRVQAGQLRRLRPPEEGHRRRSSRTSTRTAAWAGARSRRSINRYLGVSDSPVQAEAQCKGFTQDKLGDGRDPRRRLPEQHGALLRQREHDPAQPDAAGAGPDHVREELAVPVGAVEPRVRRVRARAARGDGRGRLLQRAATASC